MANWGSTGKAIVLTLLMTLGLRIEAFAVGGGPVSIPSARMPSRAMPAPPAPRSADMEYNDAWNELGFSLRQIGQYREALQAYERALQLRANFPEALEYLGETYMKLGRIDEARQILEPLRSLDSAHAGELEAVIQGSK